MKKILAVSGGVDSVVMLHLKRKDPDVVVAHFDHGIRPNSVDDYRFVEGLAAQYGLPFVGRHAALGANCSEERARKQRYAFLFQLCSQQPGRLFTAHHADDMIETAVINLLRGTGWRGLAPLSRTDIERPLLGWRKQDIYRYAADYNLSFRLDQTNTDDTYLRNRVRASLVGKNADKLLEIILRQRQIQTSIQELLEALIVPAQLPRSWLYSDDLLAAEILREFLRQNHITLTRPQLANCLTAARDYRHGTRFSLNSQAFLKINQHYCAVEQGR